MARFIPYVPTFGDRVPDAWDTRSMKAAIAVASVAQANGCIHAEAWDCYEHMSKNRFKNGLAYSFTHGHILKKD
jgi:hypothetical protein